MLLNDLVNSMNGQSTTCGWDVVVSYSVSKLNGVLQEMWNRGKYSTSPIDDYIDPTKTIRITFDVEVDSPSLQFLDGEKVLLKFGLAGRSWRSKPDEALDKQTAKESTFHRGQHTLEVEVPLVTVSGDVVESGDVERLKEAAKQNQRVFADADSAKGENIVFHFHGIPQSDWRIYSKDRNGVPTPDIDPATAAAAAGLQQWFLRRVNMVDYTIARVASAKSLDDPDSVLQPKSFVFAAQGRGDQAVLSIFLQTVGSGNGPGQTNPRFSAAESPLPQGSEASIIIRHELFRDRYLIKQLNDILRTADNPNPARIADRENGRGFSLDVYIDRKFLKNGKGFDMRWYGVMQSSADAQLLLRDNPLKLRIDGETVWSLDTSIGCSWSETNSAGIEKVSTRLGRTIITFKVNKKSTLSTNQAVIGIAVKLTCGDMAITTRPQPQPERSFGEGFLSLFSSAHWSMSTPEIYEGLKADFTDVDIKMNLNFFATKNVFAGGSDIIDIDPSQGVKTPHDVLILGKVINPR